MKLPANRQAFLEFEKFLEGLSPEELHKVLLEYVAETNHQGWEFSPRDQTGIKRFFQDFMIYQRNRIEPR